MTGTRSPIARGRGIACRSAVALGLLALACATAPPPELIAARNMVADAKQDPLVEQRASVELYEAEQALERADRAWDLQGDSDEAAHLAYVTERKVERAQLAASAREAVAQAETLAAQRDKVRLELRTQEAERSLSAAERARREAERRAQEAEQARAEAEAAKQSALASAEREAQLRKEIEELQAKQTDRGIVLTLGDVLFDVDEATLKPGAMQNLYRLVTFLKEHPDRGVLVEGHTDSTGSSEYNLGLSQRRADSVVAFLVENGIAAERLLAQGYGKAYPVATNDTPAGRQRNRRVEVVILEPGQSPAEARRALP